jgi:hypothetical protein
MRAKIAVALVSIAVLLTPLTPQAAKSYVIEECNTYNQDPYCLYTPPPGVPLNLSVITSALDADLRNNGWDGHWYHDTVAWPTDWFDQCTNIYGQDHLYTDAHLLSVFAGHGRPAGLIFGYQHNNFCEASLQNTSTPGVGVVGLGERAFGAQPGGYAEFLSCCTLNMRDPNALALGPDRQNLRQIFGFHGLAAMDSGMVVSFFDGTVAQSNASAWLGSMEHRPGLFQGDNSAVVLTYGTDAADCLTKQATAKLKGNVHNTNRLPTSSSCYWSPGPFFRSVLWLDHGDAGCFP